VGTIRVDSAGMTAKGGSRTLDALRVGKIADDLLHRLGQLRFLKALIELGVSPAPA